MSSHLPYACFRAFSASFCPLTRSSHLSALSAFPTSLLTALLESWEEGASGEGVLGARFVSHPPNLASPTASRDELAKGSSARAQQGEVCSLPTTHVYFLVLGIPAATSNPLQGWNKIDPEQSSTPHTQKGRKKRKGEK